MAERTIVRLTEDHLHDPVFFLDEPTRYEKARTTYPLLIPELVFTAGASGYLLRVPKHGLSKGQPVRVKPIGEGRLPGGLNIEATYHVRCDADTDEDNIKLAAEAGGEALELDWSGSERNQLFAWRKTALNRIRPVAVAAPVVRETGEMLLGALRQHPAIERNLQEMPNVLADVVRPICLFFDAVQSPEVEKFHWEALYYDDKMRFLALDRRFPIVRLKETLARARVFAFDPPLRILAVLAAAGPNVDATDEWKGLYSAITGKDVRVRVLTCQNELIQKITALNDPRFAAEQIKSEMNIVDHLKSFTPQILHLFGHGDGGEIVFGTLADWKQNQDPQRKQDQPGTIRLTPMNIRQSTSNIPPVWLAVLNACGSGIGNGHESLASALATSGFPVVIGMSADVASEHTRIFTSTYYNCVMELIGLAKRNEYTEMPWGSRLWETRMAIYKDCKMKDEECPYWTFPVIYTRRDEFNVFRLADDDPGRVDEAPSTALLIAAQLRLDSQPQGMRLDPDTLRKALKSNSGRDEAVAG